MSPHPYPSFFPAYAETLLIHNTRTVQKSHTGGTSSSDRAAARKRLHWRRHDHVSRDDQEAFRGGRCAPHAAGAEPGDVGDPAVSRDTVLEG